MTKEELAILRSKHAKRLGLQIREKRKALKLSQDKAAEKTGISRNSWGKIESGKTLGRMITYLKICSALGIELNFSDEDNQEKQSVVPEYKMFLEHIPVSSEDHLETFPQRFKVIVETISDKK